MNVFEAIRLVLRVPPYRFLGFGIFVLALTFYAFALPAVYTGGVYAAVTN